MKKIFPFIKEILEVVIISLAIVVPVRYFLIQPFFVKGASMEPNFKSGEYLIVDEISYRLGKPKRGDVVIFKYPLDTSQYYIKRIIGLPGEKIKADDNKVIVYNNFFPQGLTLEEPYLFNRANFGSIEIILGRDEYFVMGDNRAASFDSRKWGVLPQKNIVGKAYLRAWPFASAQIIASPDY